MTFLSTSKIISAGCYICHVYLYSRILAQCTSNYPFLLLHRFHFAVFVLPVIAMLVHCRFASPLPCISSGWLDILPPVPKNPRTQEHNTSPGLSDPTWTRNPCTLSLAMPSHNFFFYLFLLFQVLALNRGEQNKILTVKLIIPKHVENQFLSHLHKTWVPGDAPGRWSLCSSLVVHRVLDSQKSLSSSYTHLAILPWNSWDLFVGSLVWPVLFSSFCSKKQLGIHCISTLPLPPLDGILVHCRVNHSFEFAGTYFSYHNLTWVEKATVMEVTSLALKNAAQWSLPDTM